MSLEKDNVVAISSSGTWFQKGQAQVDLFRRPSLQRILARLIEVYRHETGRPVTVHELMESGWPGEIMIRESGNERVYTAIRTLRRMGLDGVLLTRDGGYMLNPDLPIKAA